MNNGAKFETTYDSNDKAQRNPFVRLRFENGSNFSIPKYVINIKGDYMGITDITSNTGFMHFTKSEIDWQKFYNYNLSKFEIPKPNQSVDANEMIEKPAEAENVQFQAIENDNKLVVLHNIRGQAEGILNVDKLGALPMPSLAITKTRHATNRLWRNYTDRRQTHG